MQCSASSIVKVLAVAAPFVHVLLALLPFLYQHIVGVGVVVVVDVDDELVAVRRIREQDATAISAAGVHGWNGVDNSSSHNVAVSAKVVDVKSSAWSQRVLHSSVCSKTTFCNFLCDFYDESSRLRALVVCRANDVTKNTRTY